MLYPNVSMYLQNKAPNEQKRRLKAFTLFFLLPLLALLASPAYIAAQESQPENLTQSELEELIDKRVDERLRSFLSDDKSFTARIEQGILEFIAKQQAHNEPSKKAKNAREVDPDSDHIYGNPGALVSLIEYSDYECPFCKSFHPTARKVIEEFNGQVNWVYRHFPLEFHNPGAQRQAEAAECASELGGNDAFWQYSDLIYERTQSNGNGFPLSGLIPLAAEIGLDEVQFFRCLDSGRHTNRVKSDYADGARAGVTGTPGNILRNNKSGEVIVITGAQPFAAVKAAVVRLLND